MKNKAIRRICVFCGSSPGNHPGYTNAAVELGKQMVARDIELVYGGGDVGLMGQIADAVMSNGGKVIGVIPEFLAQKEVAHNELTQLHIVQSMHERKALMAELSDAFIALPGGIGTFEELFEVLTWQQLGIQSKPCALLNINNYFDHLSALLDHAVAEQFLKPVHRAMLLCTDSPQRVIPLLENYDANYTDKWDKPNSSRDAKDIS